MFYIECIPFNIVKSKTFSYSMFEAAAIVSLGHNDPSYDDLKGPFLQGEKANYTKRLGELRESWEIIGCIFMLDG